MKTFLNNYLYPILFSIVILGLGLFGWNYNYDPIKQEIEIVSDGVCDSLISNDIRVSSWRAWDRGVLNYVEPKSRFDVDEPIFKMVTKFNDKSYLDYGTEKEITILKCKRYSQALKQIKQFELRKKAEYKGLERLEKKTCK
jgi:hypothetical protein